MQVAWTSEDETKGRVFGGISDVGCGSFYSFGMHRGFRV